MNEMSIRVNQIPGIVEWNFEEVKAELAARMQEYFGAVYTDERVPAAKKDLADLRKLRTDVESRRKEIKEVCMKPYKLIEKQAKELTGLIDEPINLINSQVKDYEDRKKAEKREKIHAFIKEAFSGIPDDIKDNLKARIYNFRWENASTSDKTWKEEITQAAEKCIRELAVLDQVDPDVKDAVRCVYARTLELDQAMAKAVELQKQKEIVLKNARRKEEPARIEPPVAEPKPVPIPENIVVVPKGATVIRVWADEMELMQVRMALDEIGVKYNMEG